MDEKTCETCRYTDKRADQEPCNKCNTLIGDKWEPVDLDSYVEDLFQKRYDKQEGKA